MAITKGKLIADPAVDLDGDSVAAFMRDGSGNALTSTSGALDVNIDNASIAVTATDLDIRDLAFATDSVDVSGSSVSISGSVTVTATNLDIRDLAFATDKVDVSGSSNVAVTDGGGSLTVDGTVAVSSVGGTVTVAATDLDIRNLAFASDSVDVSGSAVSISGTVAVTQSTSPWVVSATDLDIRDISHTSDSIKIGDGTDFLAVNADGSINVTGSFSINGQYAEDSAHVSGDVGLYNLAVRADAPAVASSASGDYASQTVDAYNRSWVNSGANVSMANAAASVTTTSALLIAAAAGRRKILVQNLGTKAVYLGASGVSTANGIKLPAGADLELEIGPALPLHSVAESGTQDVRALQLS